MNALLLRPSLPYSTTARQYALQKVIVWVLCAFVFTLPWESQILIPGIGTIGRMTGIAAAGVAVVGVAALGRLRRPALSHVCAGGFVMYSGLSYFWSTNTELTGIRVITYVQLFVMLWMIWQFTPEWHQQIALMRAYTWGATVSSLATVLNFLSGKTAHYERYAASGFDPNELGLILALSIPFAWYLGIISQGRIQQWVSYGQIGLAILGILLTASRGALIACVAALVFIVSTLPEMTFWRKALMFAAGIVGVLVAVWLVPQSSWERLATIGTELSSGTLNERSLIWSAGWELFRNQPLSGIGAGAYPAGMVLVLGSARAAHNLFISVLVETGLIGFTLFLCFLGFTTFAITRLRSLERRLWSVLIVTWILGVLSLTWEYRKPTWFLFGLLCAQTYSRRHKESRILSLSPHRNRVEMLVR